MVAVYKYDPKRELYLKDEKAVFALSVTNIDDALYFEYKHFATINGRNEQYRFPVTYQVSDDRHMMIASVSYNYQLGEAGYHSVYDYRNFLRQSNKAADFVVTPVKLTRLDPQSYTTVTNAALKNALRAIGESLRQGDKVENPFNDPRKTLLGRNVNFESSRPLIIGYDPYWNPVYGGNALTGSTLMYDANGTAR